MANTKAHRLDLGGWVGKDPGTQQIDKSTLTVHPDQYDDLRYDDAELVILGMKCTPGVYEAVPRFRYWDLDEDRFMDHANNKCGNQQRAFEFYWAIHDGAQRGRVVLGIGTGGLMAPSEFGVDCFCSNETHPARTAAGYTDNNGDPHFRWDVDTPLPFFDGKFGGVIANHVIEHLKDPAASLREWLRVTETGGHVCIITPDMTFNNRRSIDPSHIHEFAADEFWTWLRKLEDMPAYKLFAFNTLDNRFSFDAVLEKL